MYMNRKFEIKLAELGYLVYDKKNKGFRHLI